MSTTASSLLTILNILILFLVLVKLTNIKLVIMQRAKKDEIRDGQIIKLNEKIESLKQENKELATYKRKYNNLKRIVNLNYGASSITDLIQKKDEEVARTLMSKELSDRALKRAKKELNVRNSIIKNVAGAVTAEGILKHEA